MNEEDLVPVGEITMPPAEQDLVPVGAITMPQDTTKPKDAPRPAPPLETPDWALRYMFTGGPDKPDDAEDTKKWMAARTRINPENYNTEDDGSVTYNADRARKNIQAMAKRAGVTVDLYEVENLAKSAGLAPDYEGKLEDFIKKDAMTARGKGYFTIANFLAPNFAAIDRNHNWFKDTMAGLSDLSETGGRLLSPVLGMLGGPGGSGATAGQDPFKTSVGGTVTELAMPDWALPETQRTVREISAFVTPGANLSIVGKGGVLGLSRILQGKEGMLKLKDILASPTAMNRGDRQALLVKLEEMALRKDNPTIAWAKNLLNIGAGSNLKRQIGKEVIEQAPQTAVQYEKHKESEYDPNSKFYDVIGLGAGSVLGGLFRNAMNKPFRYERSMAQDRGVPESELGINVAEGGKRMWQEINTTTKAKEILAELDRMRVVLRGAKRAELGHSLGQSIKLKDGTIAIRDAQVEQLDDVTEFLDELINRENPSWTGDYTAMPKGTYDKQQQAINSQIQKRAEEIKADFQALASNAPPTASPLAVKRFYTDSENPHLKLEQVAYDLNKGQGKYAPNNMTADLAASDEGDKQIAKEIRKYLAQQNPNYASLQDVHIDLNKAAENLGIERVGANPKEVERKLEEKLQNIGSKLYHKASGTSLTKQFADFGKEVDAVRKTMQGDKGNNLAEYFLDPLTKKVDVEALEGIMPESKLREFRNQLYTARKYTPEEMKFITSSMLDSIAEVLTKSRSGQFGNFEEALRSTEAYNRLISQTYEENAAAYGTALGIAKASNMFKTFLLNTAYEVGQKATGQGIVKSPGVYKDLKNPNPTPKDTTKK